MDVVDTTELAPVPRSERAVYDPETGSRFFAEGEPITAAGIRTLTENGFHKVAVLAPGETPQTLIRQAQFEPLSLSKIRPGMQLGFDIYTADGSLLLTKGARLTDSTLERLARRRIREVYVRRAPEATHEERLRRVRVELQRERRKSTPPQVQFAQTDLVEQPSELTVKTIDQMIEQLETVGATRVHPENHSEALMRFARFVDAFSTREDKTKTYYVQLYQNLIAQTVRIYQSLSDRAVVNGRLILAMLDQTIAALIADRELLLSTVYMLSRDEDYLPHHAVNVSIIAVNIAAAAGFSSKQVTEVGYGALLSDIGMLAVPARIRFKKGALSDEEHLEIMRHTIYGIDRLQTIHFLPKVAPLVGYQSHERLDGSGYPHGRRSRGIHDYAKIVAIADVFHAQVARRPFRPQGRLPYQAIEEVLRMASSRKLDSRYARNLLSAISLFPVGSWVRLNSGERARVIAAHVDQFTRPVVTVLYDADGQPCSPRRVDLAKSKSLHVVAPAHVLATDPMEGF